MYIILQIYNMIIYIYIQYIANTAARGVQEAEPEADHQLQPGGL